MLKVAYPYKEKLQQEYNKTILTDKYKYYNCSNWWEYNFNLEESSWNELAFVSVDKNDNVIGFMKATIARGDDKISCLAIMNFYDLNITYSKDLYKFLIDLFLKYNFRKISFSVVIGNPIEKMYDKYINKYHGKIVGIKEKHIKLHDSKYYDEKLYEIFRDDFIKVYNRI